MEGIQPVHVQSPPTFDDSTRHTDFPKVAANLAAVRPAEPPPITMRSYVLLEDVFGVNVVDGDEKSRFVCRRRLTDDGRDVIGINASI